MNQYELKKKYEACIMAKLEGFEPNKDNSEYYRGTYHGYIEGWNKAWPVIAELVEALDGVVKESGSSTKHYHIAQEALESVAKKLEGLE